MKTLEHMIFEHADFKSGFQKVRRYYRERRDNHFSTLTKSPGHPVLLP